jgi:hypothetical protein
MLLVLLTSGQVRGCGRGHGEADIRRSLQPKSGSMPRSPGLVCRIRRSVSDIHCPLGTLAESRFVKVGLN